MPLPNDETGPVGGGPAPDTLAVAPTRFAKELTQIIRGAVAIGMDRHDALRLAIRGARDSMPPLRLKIIDDLAAHPRAYTSDVRRRVNKPWNTVAREMEALHMLEVLEVEEAPYGDERTRWYYSLAAGIDPKTLDPKCLPEKSVPPPNPLEERGWRQR